MKKLTFLFLFVSLLRAQQAQITILHWNDFHAQNLPFQVKIKSKFTNTDTTFYVGGSATLASYIKKYKSESPNILLLNAGDDFQGSPISTITKGRSQIDLMNIIMPDAMELGNHDFDYGRDNVTECMKASKFTVLAANLFDMNNKKCFAVPYMIKTINNVKIGIIGVITEELFTLSLPDNVKHLEVKKLSETVNAIVPELKKQHVNLIIALTHTGVEGDSLLALESPDIDIIVGGHSHTSIFKPKRVNGILITQAGSRGRWLGKIDVTVDIQKDTIVKSFSELIECRSADVTPDSIVAAKVDELERTAAKGLDEHIGELKSDWLRNSKGESNLGNWMCDAMRTYAKTDIAIQNSGGIRKELLAGAITVRDLWEISPFGNMLVTFSVNGATLRTMIRHQLSINDDFCQVSGLKIVYKNNNGELLLHNLKVNNQLVIDTKIYSIVTNNYVAAQSKKYFNIDIPASEIKYLNITDRDVLIEAVKKQKVINSVIEGRIKETEE